MRAKQGPRSRPGTEAPGASVQPAGAFEHTEGFEERSREAVAESALNGAVPAMLTNANLTSVGPVAGPREGSIPDFVWPPERPSLIVPIPPGRQNVGGGSMRRVLDHVMAMGDPSEL